MQPRIQVAGPNSQLVKTQAPSKGRIDPSPWLFCPGGPVEDLMCPSCGQERGSNRTCQTCLSAILEDGAASLEPERYPVILATVKAWAGRGGDGAPGDLVARARILAEKLETHLSGHTPFDTPEHAAMAAFALHYLASPMDKTPDHLPEIGYKDDTAIVGLALEALGLTSS